MTRTLALALAATAALVLTIVHAGAAASPIDRFRTLGDIAYCRLNSSPDPLTVTCFSPHSGDWVRVSLDVRSEEQPRVVQGHRSAYAGFHDARWQLLRPGGEWSRPGDTNLVDCKATAAVLTCKWNGGLAVKITRANIRVFLGTFPPPSVVVPYFRTAFGVHCGLENGGIAGTDGRDLLCWNATNGVEADITADDTHPARYRRIESEIGYAPKGFPLVRAGATLAIRCGQTTSLFCGQYKKHAAIFRCAITPTATTCRNPASHGFTLRRDGSFVVF